MPLNPVNLDLPQSNRIVVGEFLTAKNASIFKRAQILKKERKIAQVYTVNGLVKIRFTKGKSETTHTITDTVMLDTIVSQYELSSIPTDITPSSTAHSQALQVPQSAAKNATSTTRSKTATNAMPQVN